MLEAFTTEAAKARDMAIATVARANSLFINDASAAIERVASRRRTFIVDQVWDDLDQRATWKPTDRRAMGAAMLEAERLGIIRKTDEFRARAQKQCHANPRRVWESLVFTE